ncbi:MAG: hypothetical protein ACRC62_24170 [Microcoleus sp.]
MRQGFSTPVGLSDDRVIGMSDDRPPIDRTIEISGVLAKRMIKYFSFSYMNLR